MKHGISGKKFNRNSKFRQATIRDIARATLERERICTTVARAKETRKLVDRLITLGKKQSLSAKRRAFSILGSHRMVSDLFNKIAPRFQSRNGGYTRIIRLPKNRRGDNASLVFFELTEKNILSEKNSSKNKGFSKKINEKKEIVRSSKDEAGKEKKSPTTPSKKLTSDQKTSKSTHRGIKKIFNKKTPDK